MHEIEMCDKLKEFWGNKMKKILSCKCGGKAELFIIPGEQDKYYVKCDTASK